MNSKDFLKEGFVEDAHMMHQDHEVQMAREECYHAAENAIALHKLLRNISEQQGLEGWVSAKITLAGDYLKTVREYLEYELMSAASQQPMLPIAENAKQDRLDELSPNTLSNYVNKAVDDVADRSHSTGVQKGARVATQAFAGGSKEPRRFEKDPKIANRKVGISRAIGKLKEEDMPQGRVAQLPTRGADYSKYDTDHLKMMLQPGILHRNEAKFKASIRKELQKREQQSQQGVAEAGPVTIGSKLPQSDTETFGLEPGKGYYINNPKDWKKGDRPRAIQQLIPTQDKKDHIRSRLGKHKAPVLPEQDMAEGMLDSPGEQDSAVAQAIIRRILLQRTDLLAKHGPEKVGAAVDEVADFVGDVDEIGSSDVSGWVRHVEQMLGNMQQGVAEGSSCNMTMEGKRCPTHGLKKCPGYKSNIEETTAGSVAGVVNPTPKNKAKVGTLFGGTYKQKKTKA